MLRNYLIPFIPWGFQVDVKVSEEQWGEPFRALTPCVPDMIEGDEVGGWDVAAHNVEFCPT